MARFTKQAIMDAFCAMIAERPLDKITVTDIVKACGINRNTFYYYFHDIYALVDEVFERETRKVFSAVPQPADFAELFLAAIAFAKENRRMVYHIYETDHVRLEQHLYRTMFDGLMQIVRRDAEGIDCTEQQIELLAAFYAHAAVGGFVAWLNRGMRDCVDEAVQALAALLESSPQLILSQRRQPDCEKEAV